MFNHCSHRWFDCTHRIRDILRRSEYGGWRVDCLKFFICERCYQIKSRPMLEFLPAGAVDNQSCLEENGDSFSRVA